MEHSIVCVARRHIYDDDDVIFKVKSFCNK
jgi:hypothetical protein